MMSNEEESMRAGDFSMRMGIRSPKAIQIDFMDEELRNSLWNVLHDHFWCDVRTLHIGGRVPNDSLKTVLNSLWTGFFKWRVDTMSWEWGDIRDEIHQWYNEAEWNRIYDLAEFMIPLSTGSMYRTGRSFVADVNSILEIERSGYRIVGDKIVPISNTEEVNEIELALAGSNIQVTTHIRSAVEKLAMKPHPDCRNAMKESISAVEAVARHISGKPKATLSDALPILQQKIGLHEALAIGLSKLYGYSSNDGGIRHALPGGKEALVEPDVDDARFWLVFCSAMSNYLFILYEKGKSSGDSEVGNI